MRDQAGAPRKYRIGIDVGGTFTKAVLIDNATRAIVGRYSVKTTHDDTRGVAAGVVDVFRNVLQRSGVSPGDVVFIAHSTTQATNALLEGDVAKVGVLGMAGGSAAKLAEQQVHIDPIELAPGRTLETANTFVNSDNASLPAIEDAIRQLVADGARVIVASSAFGVDNTETEQQARALAHEAGLLTTCGHEISRLYGLTTRTRTAVINASILPRMNATAELTEASVREAGICAPLMIMRGDGGVMDIGEMRQRPATTMLSGPAASVAGALMHLRVTDGLYFEVGGTSTNIGVIRNGRPTVAYARVGGHETYVNSLDVRVVGIAGGSLVRTGPGGRVDVGPRSAHIAGLAYSAFAEPGAIADPIIETFEPRPGDGDDYVLVRCASGERFALTTTCAANALGYTRPGMHAHGNPATARQAFAALASYLGITTDSAARMVLERATDKLLPVLDDLTRAYKLDRDQCMLIGEGGGAGALVPFAAHRTGYPFEISKDAEVISSIGVGLALVCDVIERVIPHPKPEDLQAIRAEALRAAVRLGAHQRATEVTVEVDRQTHRVRATAMGAAELHVTDASARIHQHEARRIAAVALELPVGSVALVAETAGFRVFGERGAGPGRLRVVDKSGSIRLRRSAAETKLVAAGSVAALVSAIGQQSSPAAAQTCDLVLLVEDRLVDLSGLDSTAQAVAIAETELTSVPLSTMVAVIIVRNG